MNPTNKAWLYYILAVEKVVLLKKFGFLSKLKANMTKWTNKDKNGLVVWNHTNILLKFN